MTAAPASGPRWPPVFHKVIAFGALAENTAATARKGMAVTVTGELADDSYTAEDGRTVRGTQLQASDVAVSLRFATADVTANPKSAARDEPTT
jgi:single-strand DNA-binding protein